MTKSYPLKIFSGLLGLFAVIKVDPGKIFHCPANEQVQIGNQTVITVNGGAVKII